MGLPYPYGALKGRKSSYLYPRFGHVIHLVRSPAEQISSFTAHSNKTYNFVLRTTQLLHNISLDSVGSVASGYNVNATVVKEFEKVNGLLMHSLNQGKIFYFLYIVRNICSHRRGRRSTSVGAEVPVIFTSLPSPGCTGTDSSAGKQPLWTFVIECLYPSPALRLTRTLLTCWRFSFADATFRIAQIDEIVRYVCNLEQNRTAHALTTDRFWFV